MSSDNKFSDAVAMAMAEAAPLHPNALKNAISRGWAKAMSKDVSVEWSAWRVFQWERPKWE